MNDNAHVTMREWRVGRKLGRTVYAVVDTNEPDNDELIGMMDTRELALRVVMDHNRIFGRAALS